MLHWIKPHCKLSPSKCSWEKSNNPFHSFIHMSPLGSHVVPVIFLSYYTIQDIKNQSTIISYLIWVLLIVQRAGLMLSHEDPEMWWSVPFTCAWLYEFSFILFGFCLFITIFIFILNHVLIVTFWVFTYYKIWILLNIYCFIWNYWIIYFVSCLEVFWSVMS